MLPLPKEHFGPAEIAYYRSVVTVPLDDVSTVTEQPDWSVCSEVECIGIRRDGFEYCLAHLPEQDLQHELEGLKPGADIDLRGTRLTSTLLDRVLAAMTTVPCVTDVGQVDFSEATLDAPSFVQVRLTGDARFNGATFTGNARFSSATFTDSAKFSRATFTRGAGFDKTNFTGDVGFGRATFAGGATFNAARFTGDVGFGHATFTRGAWFGHATFACGATFTGATFTGDVGFGHATFASGATFTGATFTGGAGFGHATFNGGAWFPSATFAGGVSFTGATFTGDDRFGGAYFTGATFNGDARFGKSTFAGGATFNAAKFNGDAKFDLAMFDSIEFDDVRVENRLSFKAARFVRVAHLGPLSANLVDFTDAVFAQRAVCEVQAGQVVCAGTRFEDGVHLGLAYSKTRVQRVHFGAPSVVVGTRPDRFREVAVDLDRTSAWAAGTGLPAALVQRRHRPGVDDWAPRLVSLRDTDVSNLVLKDVNLRWCRFDGAHQLDKLKVEGRCPFNQVPTRWPVGRRLPFVWSWTRRWVLAEEHPWRAGRLRSEGWVDPLPGDEAGEAALIGPERLAALYRSLRKAFEDGKNEAGAGDFYYGEMDARRHSDATTRAEKLILGAYWALSGYGQRAWRALAWLLALVALLFGLLLVCGIPQGSSPQTGTVQPAATPGGPQKVTIDAVAPSIVPPLAQAWTAERADKAMRIALGSVVFRDSDLKLTTAGSWTVMGGRAFGPLLLALAALAVRARVKR